MAEPGCGISSQPSVRSHLCSEVMSEAIGNITHRPIATMFLLGCPGAVKTGTVMFIILQGCSTSVRSLVKSSFRVVGYAALGLAAFQAVGIGLTVMLAKLLQKTKYEQIES